MTEAAKLKQLREELERRFNDEELRTFCQNLGVEYDDLPAQGRAGKARELVSSMDRRGQLDELEKRLTEYSPPKVPMTSRIETGGEDKLITTVPEVKNVTLPTGRELGCTGAVGAFGFRFQGWYKQLPDVAKAATITGIVSIVVALCGLSGTLGSPVVQEWARAIFLGPTPAIIAQTSPTPATTPTLTSSPAPSLIPALVSTPTAASTPSLTPTATSTATPTVTPTSPNTPTVTPTPTNTATATPTPTCPVPSTPCAGCRTFRYSRPGVCSLVDLQPSGATCIDEFPVQPPMSASSIRIDMLKRALDNYRYGYSLYEVEAYADGAAANILPNSGSTANASSARLPASRAIDGLIPDLLLGGGESRWESEWQKDPQWFMIVLSDAIKTRPISLIVLKWEKSYASEYCVTLIP